jgi:hypothetical protein
MATFKDGKLVSGPSDKHFEILASHGITDGVPDKFLPQPQQNTGGGGGFFGSGYISFADRFDGGGPGRSGARFSIADTSDYDLNGDNYISEAEYAAAEANNPNFASTQGGMAAVSNAFGAKPYGSYAQEQALGSQGTNIGTTGIANLIAGGGVMGAIFNKLRGHNAGAVNPNLPLGMALGSSPNPNLKPTNFAPPANPISGTTGLSVSPQGLPENAAAPVQVIANGGLVGLRGYLSGGRL